MFVAAPKDENGNAVAPSEIKLYLNYKHEGFTSPSTDAAIDMESVTSSDNYEAQFDSKVCMPGTLFWSIRTTGPAAAADGKITIVANLANPDPT